MKKYRLFLISPKTKYRHIGNQIELCKILSKKAFMPPLALPLIAALTPNNYKIKIIIEDIEDLPENEIPDIVGITTLISTSERAFEIADFYRSKGAKVIIGGPYASFVPDKVLLHADSVAIGEAELIWCEILNDFERGKLKKVYKANKFFEFKKNVIPRWDLINHKDFLVFPVQATRGCPFKCDFCMVHKMLGNKVRFREIDDVIKEIRSLPSKSIMFADDNLTINKSYAKELIKKLKPLKITWVCQASVDIADDEELLQEMADSGCFHVLIGFESVNPESLNECKKHHNKISKYEEVIAKLHKYGIFAEAAFIVGFDRDTLEEFTHIKNFIEKNKLLFVLPNILSPYPGSDLYERIKKENRLCDTDFAFYNGAFPVMHYYNMSQIEIFEKYYQLEKEIFSFKSMSEKAYNLLKCGTFKSKGLSGISFFERISTVFKILKRYYFTENNEKKDFFKKMFLLGRNKIASYEKIVLLLVSLMGFEDFLEYVEKMLPETRKKIRQIDKGAWKDIKNLIN